MEDAVLFAVGIVISIVAIVVPIRGERGRPDLFPPPERSQVRLLDRKLYDQDAE